MSEVSGVYSGYLGAINDEGHEVGLLEQMPETVEIQRVLEWTAERTDHARIRPSWDPDHTYFFGDETRNPGLPVLRVPEK